MVLQGRNPFENKLFLTLLALVFGAMLTVVPDINAQEVTLTKRHQPSGLNSTFGYSGNSFAGYARHVRNIIAAARVDLDGPKSQQIIEANSPFELKPVASCTAGNKKPYRQGVVLTHGLTDSPYFMRTVAEIFRENCFRVMALVLPGHGTRPGDLLEVTWQEWAKAVAFGVDVMAPEVENIYLGGFSTGGALSIYHSLRDARVKGLFLFAPAIRISPKGIMANWHEAYSWFSAKSKWIDIMSDEDPYKYESFPANAADQIHLLTLQLNQDLRKIKKFMPPVFVVASEDDASVITVATLEFFREAIHPLNTFLVYSTKSKVEVEGIPPDKLLVVKSAIPNRRILSSSHTGLVLPESDSHYGVNGTYANCLHYLPKEKETYVQCKEGKDYYVGELTEENLQKGVVRRLTYNPHFGVLKQHMSAFLERLPKE